MMCGWLTWKPDSPDSPETERWIWIDLQLNVGRCFFPNSWSFPCTPSASCSKKTFESGCFPRNFCLPIPPDSVWMEIYQKYTLEDQHGTWEYTPGRGKSSSKPSFSGSVLIFGGVDRKKGEIRGLPPSSTEKALNSLAQQQTSICGGQMQLLLGSTREKNDALGCGTLHFSTIYRSFLFVICRFFHKPSTKTLRKVKDSTLFCSINKKPPAGCYFSPWVFFFFLLRKKSAKRHWSIWSIGPNCRTDV